MPIEFSDIEAELVSYLSTALEVRVATRVPNPRPTTWLQIRRSGGGAFLNRAPLASVFRDFALVDVWAWSDTETAASDLMMRARGLLVGMPIAQPLSSSVYSVDEFSGPQWDDTADPGMPVTPRMWATYEIATRVRMT